MKGGKTVRARITELLRQAGALTMREICDRLGVSDKTVSAALVGLMRLGNVGIRNDAIKRHRQYRLTDNALADIASAAKRPTIKPSQHPAPAAYYRGLRGWGGFSRHG